MDLNTAKSIFDATIAESVWWRRFKGSEFVTYICSFVAQVAKRSEIAATRRLQESFLSLAVIDTSVLAGSESRGYVPIKRVPNRKAITITNQSGQSAFIQKNSALIAESNNYPYLITEAITVPAGATVTSECIQAQRKVFQTTVDVPGKFMTRLLDPDTSDKITSFTVSVTEFNDVKRPWTPATLFRNSSANSYVYVEFYTPTEQLGIRFGNGTLGRIPTAGAVIEIDCLLTEGPTDISAGMPLVFTSQPGLNATLKVSTAVTLEAGSEREGIESIRQNALYYPSYDETLTWANDYLFFISRNLPSLSWISVWGEAEQEIFAGGPNIAFMNKIYIAAHHPTLEQAQVMSLIKNLFTKVPAYNTTFVPVQTVYLPFTIKLTGTILSSNDPALVKDQLKKALSPYAINAEKNMRATPNELWDVINKTKLLTSFKLEIEGAELMQRPPISTMRYLDIENSLIDPSF